MRRILFCSHVPLFHVMPWLTVTLIPSLFDPAPVQKTSESSLDVASRVLYTLVLHYELRMHIVVITVPARVRGCGADQTMPHAAR